MAALAESASIADLARRAREAGRLAIDTEFMGEGRYRPLLCLAQVAVPLEGHPDGVRVEVVDPLDESVDPGPLAAALADPGIEVVMHSARQDVALLRRTWRTAITALFDTQLAAGFAGLRAQLGYEAMIFEVLGVRLGKSASFTRWDARPLSEEQVAYARDDVRHLLQLADALQERLRERGRLEWAREECHALERVSDEREPEAIFAKLPRVNGLNARARAVARELVDWREEAARESDRPVPSVLNDAALVEVAKRKPASLDALGQMRGLNEPTLRRRGRALLAAVERGRVREPIPSEEERQAAPDPADAPLIALAEALVRTRAAEGGLAYELIAARGDLQRVVTSVRRGQPEPDVRTLRGWRRELVGAELLELLAGRRALAVDGALRVTVKGAP
ncbi:MAG TPA: HRDC domain-containing protein [Solirubrobacteraceae bacterium]|nr:HRDC domain-containing protein [Solirubrobacteraceae bacterium]